MTTERITKISKALSYWLRHRPEKIGIKIQKDGWVEISELMEKSKLELDFSLEELKQVVKQNDKKRFSISEDGEKIRANQGHSIDVKIDFKEITAPPVLYHGTVEEFLPSILKKGLIRGKRHHVHLSKTYDTAIEVGKRRGKPVILKINAQKMQDDGFKFYISDNEVFLTDTVPPQYITK